MTNSELSLSTTALHEMFNQMISTLASRLDVMQKEIQKKVLALNGKGKQTQP